MTSNGRSTAANSTMAWPRSRERRRATGAAGIGAVRGSKVGIFKV
jgi:hypothetical protein